MAVGGPGSHGSSVNVQGPGGSGRSSDGSFTRGLARIGPRAIRRVEPRLWVTLAGVGCILVVIGILVISGDAQTPDPDTNEPGPTWPGIVLCLLVVAAGYLLLHRFRDAPAASAGVAAVVLALPPLIYFATYDADRLDGAFRGLPFSIDAVLALSALVWILSYAVGPGRGRPLLLGAGLLFAWLFVLQVIEDPFESDLEPPVVVEGPFAEDDEFGDDPFAEDFGDDGFPEDLPDAQRPDEPNMTTVGIVSVLFGIGYLLVGRRLDRHGFAGTGTPFVTVGLITLPIGIAYLGEDLEIAGTGIAFVLAGGVLAWLGAVGGRRGTTIIGALEVLVGIGLIVGDLMEDSSPTSIGTTLALIGAAIVIAAQLLHAATREPPQTTPTPSTFGSRPGPGTGPDPAQSQAPGQVPAATPWPAPASAPPWGPPQAPPPPPPPPDPRGGTPF
jgi:hypothetical protein